MTRPVSPDMAAEISRLLGEKKTWLEIGARLGFDVSRRKRRFTPDEDQTIRVEWSANTPIQQMAQMLGRDVGTLRQRVYRLRLPTRDGLKTQVIRRHGRNALALGCHPREVNARLAQAQAAAKAEAHEMIQARQQRAIVEMQQAIAAGIDRSEAILLCRQQGVPLRTIGEAFGVTRERVRQICEHALVQRALRMQSQNGNSHP